MQYWDPERIMNKERAETQSENLRFSEPFPFTMILI